MKWSTIWFLLTAGAFLAGFLYPAKQNQLFIWAAVWFSFGAANLYLEKKKKT